MGPVVTGTRSQAMVDPSERNRRLLRLLLGVAAFLAIGTILYIAYHRRS